MRDGMAGNWYIRGDRLCNCAENEIRASCVKVYLTKNEVRIINLLLSAYSIEDMAKELKLAKRTVKAYLNRIYLRFGISGKWVKNVRLIYLLHHPEKIREEN